MKRTALFLLALTLVFGGCAKKADSGKTDKKTTQNTSQSENIKDAEKKSENSGDMKNSSSDAIVGTDGKAVTGSQFEDMVNEANDPDTSEERKAELLKEIDYMLKQVEEK